jgi:Flp pilus assembly protein TadG
MTTPRRPPSTDAGRSGSVAVEYGLLLPVFLLLVLGIVDTGRLLWTYTTLSHAVEAAARCGAIGAASCATAASIAAYAVTQAYGLTVPAAAFSATAASCGVQVSATLPFTFIIPWIGTTQPFGASNTINVSMTACYPT